MLAVLLAIGASGEAVGPADRLAGLSLLERAVLTLQHEGADRVLVVLRPQHEPLLGALRADRRVRAVLEAVGVAEGEDLAAALVARLDADARFVAARHDVLAQPALYRRLWEAELGDRLGLLAVREGEPAGPFTGRAAVLDGLSAAAPAALLERLRQSPAVGELAVEGAWIESLSERQGRARAVSHLFDACRKPVDGIVARHLNRHASIFISKRLVDTPVSPNATSLVVLLVSVAAAGFVALGGYGWTLLGAALLQAGSVLDGVDGELARVRFQQSRLGQWLDTLADDISNVLFCAGLGWGARSLAWGAVLAWCGGVAAGGAALAAAIYYVELVQLGSGDLYAIEWSFDRDPRTAGAKALALVHQTLKQDFFIFLFFCLALVGVLPYALPLCAAGAVATAGAAATRAIQRLRSK
ncbi:MAG: CDP-alcohol phosphatidyltransferase family protein [Deltaproteobacteria bacterium]|nr:CDP-alcohol phosphatidyltransferase family protein [Deltaproteobacteria bacterium]